MVSSLVLFVLEWIKGRGICEVLGGALEWMDKLLCEGGEAVDSASLGDRRAVMLGCIGSLLLVRDWKRGGEGLSSL